MKLLLFDLDGTLITTGGAGLRALERAFLELHGMSDVMEGISPAGNMDHLIIREIFQKKLGREPSPQEAEAAREGYLRFLEEELKISNGYRVMAGIPGLLETLSARRDVMLALGTGNFERGARLKLDPAGLNRYFPFGGFALDAGDRPGMLRAAVRKACERAGHPIAMEDVLVIGDTVHDVRAGKAVGAVTVAVECGHGNREELLELKPDLFMADFTQPEALLRFLG